MVNGNRFGAARSIAEEWKGDAWDRAAARWVADMFGWTTGGGVAARAAVVSTDFPAVIELATLDGTNGFRLTAVDAGDYCGRSVSSAGDVNNDGFDDVIIGASQADPRNRYSAGESYVVFGKAGGHGGDLDFATLDGTNGFRIDGVRPGDFSGGSVSAAGDVNGDGFDDIIIGSEGADPRGVEFAGESYVVFGHGGTFAPSLDLASLDGTSGFRIVGVDDRDFSGWSVSSAGDINGDGFDDVVIGALEGDPPGAHLGGKSYVVFGHDGPFAASLDLASLDGVNGFRIDGSDKRDKSGYSVSGAGDVNRDGFDDIIIGAYTADPDGHLNAGASYVVFGKAGGFAPILNLASLDGSNGFRIDGVDRRDISGYSVSMAGDVNGDGFGDVVIAAPHAGPDGDLFTGETYVVFGQAGGFSPSLALASLDGSNGFRLSGGGVASDAGDVNGDGFDDIIIGLPNAEPEGASYVVFGHA